MKIYKYCSINSLAITVLLFGCATAPQPVKLSKSEIGADKIFDYYCADNKQIRKLNISIEYVAPQLKKMAVDEAAKSYAHYAKEKEQFLKKSLFSLSGSNTPSSRGADSLYVQQPSQTYNELMEVLEQRVSPPLSVRARIERPTDSNKFILFHTTEEEHSSERYEPNSAYVSELKILIDNFTLLEPLQYQIDTYDTHGGTCYNCGKEKPLAVNEDGKQIISKAVEQKDNIWLRYIEHFTKIKEAKSSNPRVVNVDLDLDLNGFCRYGRSVSDLQSQ
jgi:hypothetical protein